MASRVMFDFSSSVFSESGLDSIEMMLSIVLEKFSEVILFISKFAQVMKLDFLLFSSRNWDRGILERE